MITLRVLSEPPERSLAAELESFESQFRYPLGEDRWFRISHGKDYTRFFRAIGEARVFVAVQDHEVLGVVSVARAALDQPTGTTIEAAYFADLKVAVPTAGRVLLRLLRESVRWARQTPTTPGFSIVMEGTARSPSSYTGRLGIPAYTELGQLLILRIPCTLGNSLNETEPAAASVRSPSEVSGCQRDLAAGRYVTIGGDATLRSEIRPLGLIADDGQACGVVEDTRCCKQLFASDGQEMRSAHLSNFGYRTPRDAASMLRSACRWCRHAGFPAFFVALPTADAIDVLDRFGRDDIVQAPATVFGYGLSSDKDWWVNTAEI